MISAFSLKSKCSGFKRKHRYIMHFNFFNSCINGYEISYTILVVDTARSFTFLFSMVYMYTVIVLVNEGMNFHIHLNSLCHTFLSCILLLKPVSQRIRRCFKRHDIKIVCAITYNVPKICYSNFIKFL